MSLVCDKREDFLIGGGHENTKYTTVLMLIEPCIIVIVEE